MVSASCRRVSDGLEEREGDMRRAEKKKKKSKILKAQSERSELEMSLPGVGSCPGDPLHPESAMACTDLCLVPFLPW